MGLPFAFVMIAVMWGLWKALSLEAHMADSRAGSLPGALSGRSTGSEGSGRPHVPWQARIRRVMAFPTRERAEEFLAETVTPALEEVASEIRESGCEATVVSVVDEFGQPAAQLVVEVADSAPFTYAVTHVEAPVPAYGGSAPRGHSFYSRLEVHLRDGGQGYDVMGYTHTQLIDDVLDQYERHLEFLRRSEGSLGV